MRAMPRRGLSSAGHPSAARPDKAAGSPATTDATATDRSAATVRLPLEQQLAVQYKIARAFAEAEDVGDIATLVLQTLTDAFRWESAGLWVLDEDEPDTLRCAAVFPTSGRLAAWASDVLQRRLRVGVGLPGRVWASGEATWVRDTEVDDNFPRREIAREVGLRHAFAFPIRLRGRVAAVVELFAADVGDVDAAQIEFLEAVGHQLGGLLERVEARRAVALSEARKTGILGAAVDAIVSADAAGHILEFNAAAEAMFGRSRTDVIGRTVADVLVPEDLRAVHQAGLNRYVATGEARILGRRVRTSAQHADGSRLPVELTVTQIRVDGQPMFTAFIRDITREREAEIARDRFLEILSHELRTPVTAIYGGSKVLARSGLPPERWRELVDDIGVEADRLYRLVEDLIVLARAERGAEAMSLEPVRLERVVERVLANFRAGWPKLDFRLAVHGLAPPVSADETYAEQLLRNLLTNAVKYGAAGGVVEVEVEHAATESIVRVLDRGIGMDPSETSRLFEIDYRSPLTEGLAQGSGIGLFVARWLVEAMGGRIWAAPRAGGGSEFGFALPTVDAEAATAHPLASPASRPVLPLDPGATAAPPLGPAVSAGE
jgi:PAS domain S-box-containing protein